MVSLDKHLKTNKQTNKETGKTASLDLFKSFFFKNKNLKKVIFSLLYHYKD